jgi:hypothetical protein
MTESSFLLTFSSTNLRLRVAITFRLSRRGPTVSFRIHSEPLAGRGRGYSRWEDRSSHLCFKTVRESFLSHGSSVLRLLSRVPRRACDLFFHTFASCDAHPYLTLPPVHSVCGATGSDHLRITVPTSAYPRAFLAALASWGIPPPCRMVDTSSLLRTTRGYSVPDFRLALAVGLHSSPGFSGVSPGRLQNRPALRLAFLAPATNPRWLAHLTTIRTWIRLPVRLQLCSTGFSVGFCVTAF